MSKDNGNQLVNIYGHARTWGGRVVRCLAVRKDLAESHQHVHTCRFVSPFGEAGWECAPFFYVKDDDLLSSQEFQSASR